VIQRKFSSVTNTRSWGLGEASERSGEEYVFRAEAIRCITGGAIFGAFPLAYSPATAPSDLPSAFFKHLLNTKTNRETARAALRVVAFHSLYSRGFQTVYYFSFTICIEID
jgi:hypothetical protein